MTIPVSDRSSNKPEQLEHAAEVIGRSSHRLMVFKAIYTGKAKIKSVPDLMKSTKLGRTRVLDAGKKLSTQDIVEQVRVDGVTGYAKIGFFQTHRDKILKLAENVEQRRKLITKRRPERQPYSLRVQRVRVDVFIPKQKNKARFITIDDIDSFKKVCPLKADTYIKMPESTFKRGMARILMEKGDFNDWGGESSDLVSTRVLIRGKRHSTAFAFKGPGTTGKLTPKKMGKNGDQIQRLIKCAADVFLIQYWGQIDESILSQLENFAKLKAYMESREIWYGIIDGIDSARVIKGYREQFDK